MISLKILLMVIVVGPSKSTKRGEGESVLDNFNLNLLQLVIAHILSAKKWRSHAQYIIIYVETQNERKPLNAFLILYKDYIHFPTPTIWEHQLPDLHEPAWRKLQIFEFIGTDLKEAQTPWIYRNQPEGISNSLFLAPSCHPVMINE